MATLVGNSTLFYQLPAHKRKKFLKHHHDQDQVAQFINSAQAQSPSADQGAFFIVGNPQYAAVHTEPPTPGKRLFFSLVPGPHKEIEELSERFKPQKGLKCTIM